MLLNASMASKPDKTPFVPWDVFSDLKPIEEDTNEHANAEGILTMFKFMAAGQKAREDSD